MAQPRRNKFVAILFALFGGMIGLHKFYLREVSGGIFYLFLFFMSARMFGSPISALLGFFDAFRLLTMSNDQFDRKYNNVPQNSPYRRSRRRSNTAHRRTEVVQQRSTKRHNPFIKSGARLYKEYELEEAASDYEKALEITPDNKEVLFNISAIYSLLENKEASLKYLDRLVQLGYKDFEKIQNHDDLAFIRIQPEFEAFKNNNYRLGSQSKITSAQKEDLLQDDLLLSQLNKLMELRKKGLLSEEEFGLEKRKIMHRR